VIFNQVSIAAEKGVLLQTPSHAATDSCGWVAFFSPTAAMEHGKAGSAGQCTGNNVMSLFTQISGKAPDLTDFVRICYQCNTLRLNTYMHFDIEFHNCSGIEKEIEYEMP
jgi:hypothetical protein